MLFPIRLTWLAALAVCAVQCSLAPRVAGSREESVRQQLTAEYATIVAGFKRDDPSPWIERLAPDFHLTLFNGSVQSRDWAVNYVRENAHAFRVDSLSMRLKELRERQDVWEATVEQLSSRTFTDSSGVHRLDVGAMQLETWKRVAGRWLLAAVREKDVLYLRRDGQPPAH